MTTLTQHLKDMRDRLLRQEYPIENVLVHIDDLLYIMRELRNAGYVLVRQIGANGKKLSVYDVFTSDYQEKAGFVVYVDKMRFGEAGKVYLIPDSTKLWPIMRNHKGSYHALTDFNRPGEAKSDISGR